MPRGGYRPGAGRKPKGQSPVAQAVDAAKVAVVAARVKGKPGPKPKVAAARPRALTIQGQTPLEYLLSVMNDPSHDEGTRTRAAIAAAPYVHERADNKARGKKEAAEAAAQSAGRGSSWGDDLTFRAASH